MKFVGDSGLLIFNEDYLDLIEGQPISGNRKSFDKFLEKLPSLIKEYYLPVIEDKWMSPSSTVYIDRDKTMMLPVIKQDGMEDINVRGVNRLERSEYYVPIRINVRFTDFDNNKPNYVKVLDLPFVSREGLIFYNKKEYNFINAMEIDDTIVSTKKRGEPILKLVNDFNSFTITAGNKARKVLIEMFKKKVNALYIASLLYIEDYGLTQEDVNSDTDEIKEHINYIHNLYMDFEMGPFYEDIVNSSVTLGINDGRPLTDDGRYYTVFGSAIQNTTESSFDFTNHYISGRFSLSDSRSSIDKMCSFDNVIGEILAEEIVLPKSTSGNPITYPVGTTITKSVVSNLNLNAIDKVRFKRTNYLEGDCYLANPIILPCIPVNTRLSGTMKERFSDFIYLQDGTTTDIAYITSISGEYNPFIFLKGTKVDKDFCDLVRAYNNYANGTSGLDPITCIRYSKSKPITGDKKNAGRSVYTHYFDSEVFYCNRVYPIEDMMSEIVRDNTEDEDIANKYGSYGYVFVDRFGNIRPVSQNLTFHDMISILHTFDLIRRNVKVDIIPDADTSFRKKMKQIEHRFTEAFIYATEQIRKSSSIGAVKDRLNGDIPTEEVIKKMSGIFSACFFEYLRSKEVIQQVDFTNPLSVLSGVTKANTLCKANSVPDSVRRMSTGQFARICPYETPQSKKLGVVNNLTTTSIIEDGYVKAAYYAVKHAGDNTHFVDTSTIHYLSVIEQEKYRIGDIKSVKFDRDTGLIQNPEEVVLSIIPDLTGSSDRQNFNQVPIKYLDYITTSVNGSCSHSASTIPFIGANDSTRITFGISMVKQTKSLVNGEEPIVATTAFYNIARLLRSFAIIAEYDGEVVNILERQIIVKYDEPFYGDSCPIRYKYKPITFSTYTVSIMTPNVKVGDKFKKGDILVSSNFIKNGSLVTGVNAIIAYIPNGYNYEDGVFASKRLSTKLTSFGPSKQDTPYERDKRISFSGYSMRRYVDSDNPKICDNKISIYKNGNIVDTITKDLNANTFKGFYYETEMICPSGSSEPTSLRVRGITVDSLNESDKICNRHGNKGVSCYIMKTSNMPYLNNGETLDILYNPCGIVSRMNVGQVLEAHLGLACMALGIRSLSPAFYGANIPQIGNLIKYAYELANSKSDSELDTIFNSYSIFPTELHEYCRSRINSIRVWADTFDEKGMAYVYDPKTGERSENRCVIGVNYIYKLVQEGSHKIATRGGMVTETYVKSTQSPTKGIDKGGGQSEGRMEIDVLFGYGAMANADEIMNYRSDNYVERANWTIDSLFDNYEDGVKDYLIKDDTNAMRRSAEYMYALLFSMGLYPEMDDKEIFSKREYCEKKLMSAASDSRLEEYVKGRPDRVVKMDISPSQDQVDSIFGSSSNGVTKEDMF